MLALRSLVQKRIMILLLLALSMFAVTGSVATTIAQAQDEQAQDGDEGFDDWGLFGLLGLAGLAGLRRNRNEYDNRRGNVDPPPRVTRSSSNP